MNFMGDCLYLIRKLLSLEKDLSDTIHFTDLIKDLLMVYSNFSIYFDKRDSHKMVHFLASHMMCIFIHVYVLLKRQ